MRTRTAALACFVLPLLVQATMAGPRSRTFQQGFDAYSGVRDTWVSRLDWDTPPQHTVNYGQNTGLTLSRDGGDSPLLAFDLSSIPPNSAVLAATLTLHNTTPADNGSPGTRYRRITLHRVLRAWDEGNQAAAPIDTPGRHGATGDFAFRHFAGEGTDVPWAARGMAAGQDFAAAAESFADVLNEGPYAWDVTSLVRTWVRGESPNFGLVLRDASGYDERNTDWRTFVSSQGAEAAQRPRLVVVYNPDVPHADAGPDRAALAWDGGAVNLDGSASHDHQGGNDASLRFAWRAHAAAYGSALAGMPIGSGKKVTFFPDAAGEWEIELAVTNDQGETATDTVHLQLLRIAAGHPRIFVTPATLPALRARAVGGNPRWQALVEEADDADGSLLAKALAGLVGGESRYCTDAVARAVALAASPDDYSSRMGDVALVYDWCHDRLSSEQRAALVAAFNAWGDVPDHPNDVPGWGNYWPRWGYSYVLVGLATQGDNARAVEWLDEYRHRRFQDIDVPLLDRIADGGGWPEGTVYDWIANLPRVKAVEAWRTATGEDLFLASRWFRERLGYLLLHRWPGLAEQWGLQFHPYPSTGDAERNRGTMANYERIMALLLVNRFPDDPLARQLQAVMAAPPTARSLGFEAHDELLWFEPERLSSEPTYLTHLAVGTGTVFVRSDWRTGAADTDPSPTYLTFQCGDHFTYHQHFDQNTLALRKGADLLVDSGVYSGDGLSYHDQNYYVRTIAHNTLVVLNPGEDFSHARPDAESNDGGQRTVYPGSRSPGTISYFDEHRVHYETGSIARFADEPRFTYVLGDATAAYNNPTYNQALDTDLAGNLPKVSRFVRELVYLRPAVSGGADFVVLLDRVGVTAAAFSGANTKLLFHTLAEPVVEGAGTQVSPGEKLYRGAGTAEVTSGAARLFMRALLPADRNIRVVGGRGEKAFWVFGTNFDWHWSASEPQPRPVNDFEDTPYGEWRLELEPADTALDHVFLTVLAPTTPEVATMPATTLVTATGLAGAVIDDAGMPRVVLFSSAPDGRAPSGTLTYSVPLRAPAHHALFDLSPGQHYRARVASSGTTQTVTLTPDPHGGLEVSAQGVLDLELGPASRVRRHLSDGR